jgi:hypothetical protein
MVTETLSATEQSILTISPTLRLIFPSKTASVDPTGIGTFFTKNAVVFWVWLVCVVVLTIVTDAVTCDV